MTQDIEKFKDYERAHWRFFLELEQEMLATRKYVDFDEKNFSTFSIEYLKLFQAVCGEIDILGKVIAQELDSSFKPDDGKNNIFKWWFIVQSWFDNQKSIEFCRMASFQPWAGFEVEQYRDSRGAIRYRLKSGSQTPSWWRAYTSVKHQRTLKDSSGNLNYTKANLGNLCNAFSALYLLEKAFLSELGNKEALAKMGNSVLFEPMSQSYVKGSTLIIG